MNWLWNRCKAATPNLLCWFLVILVLVNFYSSVRAIDNSANCGPASVTFDPPALLEFATCVPPSFDFGAPFLDSGVWHFEIVSGPGTIGEYTGLWQWADIHPADSGLYSLDIHVRSYCDSREFRDTVQLHFLEASPEITAGCATTSHVAGDTIHLQMEAQASPCPPSGWSILKNSGPEATFSISPGGLVSLYPSAAGTYKLTMTVLSGSGYAGASCSHTFVVHGGRGCCSGQRGNLNLTGITDLSDLSLMISYLTSPNIVLPCYDAANLNGTGVVDLTDLSTLISYLTAHTGTLQPCP